MRNSPFCIVSHYTTLVVLLCISVVSIADQEKYLIRLNQQPLNSALIELGRQGNTSIIFSAAELSDLSSPAIYGEMTIFDALKLLLASSDLTAKKINNSVVAIVSSVPEGVSIPSPMEEVTIVGRKLTGSRLGVVGFESSSPVDIVMPADLDISGAYDVGNFLKSVPAVSGNSSSTAVSNGGNGTSTVTLRGLPANNTLVLMNGRRLASNGIYGSEADLNSIPSAAVERIEILKGGASAVYGSDAIAGVVNVILKDSFEGVQLAQYAGLSGRSDVNTTVSEVLMGSQVGQTSLFLSFEHFEQEGLFSADRELSASSDNRSRGGTDLRSSATPLSRITLSDGQVYILDTSSNPDNDGTDPAQFRLATGEDLYDYRESTSSISPSRRDALYLSALWRPSEAWSVKADGSYVNTYAAISYAPTPLLTNAYSSSPRSSASNASGETSGLVVSADNIYNPFKEDIYDIRRRIVELDSRKQINGAEIARFNVGFDFEGKSSQWNFDMLWNEAHADESLVNILDFTKTAQALGPESSCLGLDIDGCVPLNLFGPVGSITQEQLDYIRTDASIRGSSSLSAISGSFETRLAQLPAGAVHMVGGFDIREESIASSASENNDNLIGGSLVAASEGQRRVREVYAEIRLPIASQRLGVKSFDMELAFRHSNYSDFGEAFTPKISLLYRPTDHVLLRSTFSQGFRAPSLGELHRGEQTSFVFLSDPCALNQSVESFFGCDQQSDPTQNQFLTTFAGEPDLKPEESDSYTIGAVWSNPVDDLYMSLDYFHINQRNVVDANAQYILDQNANSGLFSEFVQRDENGNIQRLYAPFINIGLREVSGVDASIRWFKKTKARGKFTYSLNASYLRKFIDQISPDSPMEDVSGTFVDAASEGNGALPRWKVSSSLLWQKRGLQLSYSANYIGSMTEVLRGTDTTRKISSWFNHDAHASYQFAHHGLSVSFGINNIWDKDPPLIVSALNDNYDARTYDLIGRFFYGKIRYTFD